MSIGDKIRHRVKGAEPFLFSESNGKIQVTNNKDVFS